MELNEKIKYLRTKHKLTLEEVGAAVGVGKSTVLKWENGDIANMRRDKILALANILQTTPAYLMGWDENDEAPPEISFKLLSKIPLLNVLEDFCKRYGKNFSEILAYYQNPINEASLVSLISGWGLKGNDNITLSKILGVKRVEDAIAVIEDNPARYLPLVLTRQEIRTILAIRQSNSEENKEDFSDTKAI